jgi:hypothetical protein
VSQPRRPGHESSRKLVRSKNVSQQYKFG